MFLLRGIVNKFAEKGLNRVAGTVIAYVIMILVIALILLFMFSPAFGFFDQIQNIINDIPKYVAIVVDWAKDMYAQYGHFLNDQNVQK